MFRLAKTHMLKVDFRTNLWDARVQKLTEKGFSAKLIQEETGLTMPQVTYRMCKLGGVRAYREGRTDKARSLIRRVDDLLKQCKSIQRESDRFWLHAKRG